MRPRERSEAGRNPLRRGGAGICSVCRRFRNATWQRGGQAPHGGSWGLKSQIWGEDQIISQVKAAIGIAREQGRRTRCWRPCFETLWPRARRSKQKFGLPESLPPAAARAVDVLRRDMGKLDGKRALVIGNGEMGRLSASLLREAGCSVTVTLRTYRHGETVVPAGCGVVPYDDRFSAMEGMDLVLSATTSPHYTVTAEQMSMLKRRPSWVVDLYAAGRGRRSRSDSRHHAL